MNRCNKIALLAITFLSFFFFHPAQGHPKTVFSPNRPTTTAPDPESHSESGRVWDDNAAAPGGHLSSNTALLEDPPRFVSLKADKDLSWRRYNPWEWFFNTGYRHDDLDWSFALPGINIRSELQWRNLESIQFEFGLQRRLWYNFRLKGSLAYAFLFAGDNQDSDYNGNNRTEEFSRSNNSTQDGDLWDVSLGLAYDLYLFSDRFAFSPSAGYSYHDQNLQITRGVQTIPPLGPFQGLNSSYDPTWYGPWLGAEFQYNSYGKKKPAPGYEVSFGAEYHFADFEAQADWNLRADLAHPVSFRQDADGSGWVLTGGINYLFNARWSVNLIGKYQKWQTSSGNHRFFFSDGRIYRTDLNRVSWDSYALLAGMTCRF